MGNLRPWLLALGVLVGLVASAGRASADRASQAEAEMVKAKQAMERRDFEGAIPHLLQARSLAPEASGPYLNLGLAYAALGRCDQATPMLEEYLRRKTRDPQPSAAATLAACRAATPPAPSPAPSSMGGIMGKAPPPSSADDGPSPLRPAPSPDRVLPPIHAPPPPPAHLTVKVSPVAARVNINGKREAADSRLVERDLPAGGYQLDVSRDGYHPETRSGWLIAGEGRTEVVALKKRRVWPTVVGVLTALAVSGAIVAVIVTQVGDSSSPSNTQPGHNEVGFMTATAP